MDSNIEINAIELIRHPEMMNKDTLYALRSLLARNPFYQTARLLFIRNLYILHDPTFDEELRKASLFIADRRVVFYMVEGEHYRQSLNSAKKENARKSKSDSNDRTFSLIEQFLTGLPEDEEPKKKKLTQADAKTDYVAYLLQTENEDEEEVLEEESNPLKGQSLIDQFIEKKPERMTLQTEVEFKPEVKMVVDNDGSEDEDCFTETLAKIYIKQGRYEKAIEIIRKLRVDYPKKNSYFADQIRFLEKLIINNKNKK